MIEISRSDRKFPARRSNLNKFFLFSIFYLASFSLFYMEPITIGPLNFAALWKIAAFGIIFLLVLSTPRYQSVPAVAFWGGIYSAASVINPSVFVDPAETIGEAMKYLYIPSIFIVLYGLHRKRPLSPDAVLRFATHVSVFISLSGIPFILGVLDPISSSGYDLSLFGIDGRGFNGIFFHSHGASITMATSAIVLVWAAKHSSNKLVSAFLLFLAVFSLYCTFQTYARTGYAMAGLGLLLVILLPIKSIKILAAIPVAAITIYFAADALSDNQTLKMRLQGQNIYTVDSLSGGDFTSGRIRFWAAGIDSYLDSPPEEWLFGAGPYYGKERMLERVNMEISTHNDFVNSLLFSGILGFGVFLTYTLLLLRMAWRGRRDHLAGDLIMALTGAYFAQLVLQGEQVFLSELLLVLILFSTHIRPPLKIALNRPGFAGGSFS